MTSWLCRALGCIKKAGPKKDYLDEIPDDALSKAQVKLQTQKSRREDSHKKTASQAIDIPEVELSNGPSKSEISQREISMISKECHLMLSCYWNHKLVFEHLLNNAALKYRIVDQHWPKDFLDRFSMLAECLGIQNKSEGLVSPEDADPFFWKADQKLVKPTLKGYKWLPEIFDRFIFKRLQGTLDIAHETVIACSGNVLRLAVGPSGLAVAFIGSKDYEQKVWPPKPGCQIRAGRMLDCEIQLNGSNCSRYQLTITYQSGVWSINEGYHDAKPSKGIWVLQEDKEHIISTGDQYIVGGFMIKILDPPFSDTIFNGLP